jgi:hypothetical protein
MNGATALAVCIAGTVKRRSENWTLGFPTSLLQLHQRVLLWSAAAECVCSVAFVLVLVLNTPGSRRQRRRSCAQSPWIPWRIPQPIKSR